MKLPLGGSSPSPYKKQGTSSHLDGILSPSSHPNNITLRLNHAGPKKGIKEFQNPPEPVQESFEEVNERGWVVRGVKPVNSRSQSPNNRVPP